MSYNVEVNKAPLFVAFTGRSMQHLISISGYV